MRRDLVKAAGAFLAAIALPGRAQESRPGSTVRLVVPFPAGGIADIVGREIVERLAAGGAPRMIVENRAGAGGSIGTDAVARAAADGSTLLLASTGHTIRPSMSRKLSWDPLQDFEPIAVVAEVAHVLAVPASLGPTTLSEFTSLAKASPGKYSYGSSGNGSLLHLAVERYRLLAGVDLVHVPYKGQPEALADLIDGRIHLMPLAAGIAAPHLQSGKLRALAVASGRRSTLLPTVPTTAEAGFADLTASAWFAVLAPARVPRSVVTRLGQDLQRMAASPEFAQKLGSVGGDVTFLGPEASAAFVAAEVAKWRAVVQGANLKVE